MLVLMLEGVMNFSVERCGCAQPHRNGQTQPSCDILERKTWFEESSWKNHVVPWAAMWGLSRQSLIKSQEGLLSTDW